MKLVKPNINYKDSYYDLVNTAKENNDIYEMGHAYKDNENFDEMIERLKKREKGIDLRGDVPATIFWILDNNVVVGTIDLRHILNKSYYERLGHVAYYIHPKYRKKGYATKALSLAIKKYKKHPINKILITCYSDNIASRKVILKNGGILEKVIQDPLHPDKKIERYLIDINNTDIKEAM